VYRFILLYSTYTSIVFFPNQKNIHHIFHSKGKEKKETYVECNKEKIQNKK